MTAVKHVRIFVTASVVTLAAVAPAKLNGQTRFGVGAHLEVWSIASEHLGESKSRRTASVSAGVSARRAAIRLVAGHASQGEVDPGWTVVSVEIDPFVARYDEFVLAIRVIAGGHYMDVRNRHRVIERCTIQYGCMFEASAYAQGWSSIGGLGGATGFSTGHFSFTAGVALVRLFRGANSGETMPRFHVGVEYLLQ